MRIRDENKEKLVIEKAIALIVQDGFQGFSMNKLAKACNVSVATLYIYYHDKDDLIRKIGVDIGRNFFTMTLRDFSSDMDFRTGLRKQWENRAAFAIQFPLEVACFEIIRHSPHGDYILGESLSDFKMRMGDFFINAVKNKQLIELSFEVFWAVAYGPLYALLRFHMEGKSMGGKPFILTTEMTDEALEVVIKALTP
ncbi:MAG TPA: TetR/AcrR family transcriptional regulator [Flavobacterium sp.]|nr:TetR/AcrR family transcriptional regulator [Flavobacterium sp.]